MAEVYAEPDPRIAAVFGRSGALLDPVAGGWRVRGEGRWPFNSGCHHAQWDLLRADIARADGTVEPAFIIVPFADLVREDDWHVMGACATGSSTTTCGAIFVPAHRVAPLFSVPIQQAVPAELLMAQNVALPLGETRATRSRLASSGDARGAAA